MSSKPSTDQTIAELYSAAVEPDRWGSALDSLTALFDARAANCFLQNSISGEFVEYHYTGYSDRAAEKYVEYYNKLDLGFQALLDTPPGTVYSAHQVVPESMVQRSEFYQDFYIPEGLRYSAGGSLFDGDNRVVLAIHRPDGLRPASEDAIRDLQRILNHLPNVFRVRSAAALSTSNAWMTSAALEALPRPVLIVDSSLKVRYLNKSARHLLSTTKEISLKDGRMTAADADVLQRLGLRVKSACARSPSVSSVPLNLLDGSGKSSIQLGVVPLQTHLSVGFGKEDRLAMVLLHQPFKIRDWVNASERPFGLSRAEMAVVAAMIKGLTAVEYADSAAVTIATVRTQIKSILAKTGTRRMAEVMMLFAATDIAGI